MYYHDGIILVGLVNWRNVVIIFSLYVKDSYGIYLFVFVFGDIFKNDSEELIKNNYYKRDYYKIKNYIELIKDLEEFRNKMIYLFNFNGISKVVLLITGFISRF